MRVSADVHGPTPRWLISTRSRASPSVAVMTTRRDRVAAACGLDDGARLRRLEAGAMPRPRRDHAASRRSLGGANIGRGVGPGARSPCHVTMRRQAAKACMPVTFCSMIALGERVEEQVGAADPQAGVAVVRRGDEGMRRRVEVAAARRVRRTARAAVRAPIRRPDPRLRRGSTPGAVSRIASVATPSGVRLARQIDLAGDRHRRVARAAPLVQHGRGAGRPAAAAGTRSRWGVRSRPGRIADLAPSAAPATPQARSARWSCAHPTRRAPTSETHSHPGGHRCPTDSAWAPACRMRLWDTDARARRTRQESSAQKRSGEGVPWP